MLEDSNQELSSREEEIARQNEELQSQGEELERQSEELRVANDDLASRERMLSRLLALSRTLAGELTRDEVMQTVCESLADLLAETAQASALLLREGDRIHAYCHFGFGPEGPKRKQIAYESSFASLLLSRGQAGFLQDVMLRPEIVILEPADGSPFRSVLGAPITARGRLIGTVEVYAREATPWSEEQVSLIGSMAAQASLSLETARLFEEVSQAKRRFETVFRTLPIAVFACDDPECRQVSANPAAATLFAAPLDTNFSPFSPLGGKLHGAVYRGGRPVRAEELPLVRAVRSGQEIIGEEYELAFPTGRRASVLMSAAPFYDAQGKLAGGACVLVDITLQKHLERDLDARRRESEEASVRKTRFLAAVSHDIRTPANAIRLQAELIKRTIGEPALASRLPEFVQALERNAIALVELVGDVLDLTRFDSGKVELQEVDFSLGETLVEECEHLRAVAAAKGLALECRPVDPPLWVRADRVKIGRVLGNLIENAIKFTDSGTVEVSAELREGSIELCVADTGAGIPAEHHAHVFDEFFQLRNPERDRSKGRGLGLAICKRLIDAMGGAIRFESVPAGGTRFIVTLPADRTVSRPLAVDRFASGAARPAALPGRLRLSGLRVLLVEDHEDSRRATAELLRAEGGAVLEATNGGSALRQLDEADVLLLDLMLPDLDGFEVLKLIHAKRPRSLRAIIVLTGDSASRSREEIELLGVALVLEKPIEPARLVSSIVELLR